MFKLSINTKVIACLILGISATLLLSYSSVTNAGTPYPKCDVAIKASEGTNKLNKVLECLNKKIDTLYGVASKDAKSSVVIIEPGKPINIPQDKCVNIETLPTVSRIILHNGTKICDKNGWTWIRAFPENYAQLHYDQHDVFFRYSDKEEQVKCKYSGGGCELIEPVSKQKIRVIVEIKIFNEKKGRSVIYSAVLRKFK